MMQNAENNRLHGGYPMTPADELREAARDLVVYLCEDCKHTTWCDNGWNKTCEPYRTRHALRALDEAEKATR